MTSSAISAQGSTIQIGTGTGGAKTITGVAVGFPTIITAASHGFGNGDVVTLAGLTGANASALNGQQAVVKNVTANTFAVDVNTTGLTITASGTATPVTYTKIANVNSVSGFDGTSAEYDKTNLESLAKEIGVGVPDSGQVSLEVHADDNDPGQMAASGAYTSQVAKPFKLTLPNGKVYSFSAYVKKYSTALAVDSLVKRTIDLRITGPYTVA